MTTKQTIQNINQALANGGKEKVLEENRHKPKAITGTKEQSKAERLAG